MQCKNLYFVDFLLKNFQFSVFQGILELYLLLILGSYICGRMAPKTMGRCKKEERPEIDKRCHPLENSPSYRDWLWMQSDNTLQWDVGKNYRWDGAKGNQDPIIIGSKAMVTCMGFRSRFLIPALARPLLGHCHHRTLDSGYDCQTESPAINIKTSEYQTATE